MNQFWKFLNKAIIILMFRGKLKENKSKLLEEKKN